MPRLYKPLKQRPNGVWFVQIKGQDGRRLTRSLETTDPLKAAARAQQALEELQQQDQKQSPSRWRADGTWPHEAVQEIKEAYRGSPLDAQEIAEQITGQRATDENSGAFLHKPTERLAEQLVGIKHINWFDLVREAEAKWKRKNGAGYSNSWHTNVRMAIKACPYESPLQLTPNQLNAWVKQMQDQGLAPKTIQSRCTILSGLLTNSIKSGLLSGHVIHSHK